MSYHGVVLTKKAALLAYKPYFPEVGSSIPPRATWAVFVQNFMGNPGRYKLDQWLRPLAPFLHEP